MFQLAFLQMHGVQFPGIQHYVSRIPPGNRAWIREMAAEAAAKATVSFRDLIHRGLEADLESTFANYAIQSVTEDTRMEDELRIALQRSREE